MIAIILAAGVGARIRPFTDNCPKCLLVVGGKTILEMMIAHIQDCGIEEVIIVLGYLHEQIEDYVKLKFPELKVQFVINDRFAETNTAYSLMLAKDIIQASAFIKFDADVMFDREILIRLIDCEYANCLCIDRSIELGAEEIKVLLGDNNMVLGANKSVNPTEAAGESIGIEKISGKTAVRLFEELEVMMEDRNNHQEYYEGAYERLIESNVEFYALDISGLKWIEIDTKEDLANAERKIGKGTKSSLMN